MSLYSSIEKESTTLVKHFPLVVVIVFPSTLHIVHINWIMYHCSYNHFKRWLGEDTDEWGGGDGQNGSHRDGLLGIAEVPRPVRPRHDAYRDQGREATGSVVVTLPPSPGASSRRTSNWLLYHQQTVRQWIIILSFGADNCVYGPFHVVLGCTFDF